ncbi:MAG: oxygenase MpaB family protein [Ferruginibacter sp.]
MEYFVDKDSIVRKIWGKGDTILFIFAGASAEFALNKAVDWLYFTGKLPADPIGRLFSTVCYAQQIVFSNTEDAYKAIDRITAIHAGVEKSRQAVIPDWAYRDVLFMLIHYSIASFEILERKLSHAEKEEVFNVFFRVGSRMKLKELPVNYDQWIIHHDAHLQNDLLRSEHTVDLFKQYKKQLGGFRYRLLLDTQKLIVPDIVRNLMKLNKFSLVQIILPFYKISRVIKLDKPIKALILPANYKKQIKALDNSGYDNR